MKGAGKDEVVVGADLEEAGIVELLLKDQAAGLVNDNESEDSPSEVRNSWRTSTKGTYMVSSLADGPQLAVSGSTWPFRLTGPSMGDHELLRR